jgi:hypothetical protein
MARRLAFVVLAAALLGPAPGRAEDRVTVRGAYFREHSTRVVQPMIQVGKDLPYGFEAGAHFLVDAITSASVASGTNTDSIFTEMRKEAGAMVAKNFGPHRLQLTYRQSREPDYISHTTALNYNYTFWENTGTIAVAAALGDDTIGPMLDRSLITRFAGVRYVQALSPTALGMVGYEVAQLDGYQGNPYVQVPNLGREKPPTERWRHAAIARIAYYLPTSYTGLQAHYRFYVDNLPGESEEPWDLTAHTFEGRVYQAIGPGLELRATYRYHSQGAAQFWCNSDPSQGGVSDCYGTMPRNYSADAKLGPLATHVLEGKLVWEARPLAPVPLLGWFAAGDFEISYGRYLQNTRYGGAHLLQTGYTLAF